MKRALEHYNELFDGQLNILENFENSVNYMITELFEMVENDLKKFSDDELIEKINRGGQIITTFERVYNKDLDSNKRKIMKTELQTLPKDSSGKNFLYYVNYSNYDDEENNTKVFKLIIKVATLDLTTKRANLNSTEKQVSFHGF